jgi:hypothetical protein
MLTRLKLNFSWSTVLVEKHAKQGIELASSKVVEPWIGLSCFVHQQDEYHRNHKQMGS